MHTFPWVACGLHTQFVCHQQWIDPILLTLLQVVTCGILGTVLGVSSRFLVFNSHFGWVLYAPIDLLHFRYQRQGQDTDLHVQNDWWTIHPIHGWTSTRINWTAGCNSSQKVTVNDNHHPSYLKVAPNTLDTKPGELSRYTSKTTTIPPQSGYHLYV